MKHIIARVLIIGLLAVSIASAETYKFHIADKVQAGQSQLKPGNYLLDVDGTKAVLKDNKGNTIDVKAKAEQVPSRAKATMIGVSHDNGVTRLTSVLLAGTSVRVVFE